MNAILTDVKKKNPLQMFHQAAINKMLQIGIQRKMKLIKQRHEREERENIYGFKRKLLKSPRS